MNRLKKGVSLLLMAMFALSSVTTVFSLELENNNELLQVYELQNCFSEEMIADLPVPLGFELENHMIFYENGILTNTFVFISSQEQISIRNLPGVWVAVVRQFNGIPPWTIAYSRVISNVLHSGTLTLATGGNQSEWTIHAGYIFPQGGIFSAELD